MEHDGWYFLTPRPSIFTNHVGTQEMGAIRLRVQWVHSFSGLLGHIRRWTAGKIEELTRQLGQIERDEAERRQAMRQALVEAQVGHGNLCVVENEMERCSQGD